MQVYIHIPFCQSKCPYCAFGSIENAKNELKKAYFDALEQDINSNLKYLKKGVDSVFIGGGTPSAVEAKHYEKIFEIINSNLIANAEITSEANPNSATKEWLAKMRSFGVNRISFGAQSFNEKKLKMLGRIHDSKAIYDAVENAKSVGFNNINVDIIYGTKLDTKKLILSELENISNLNIPHISAYSLTIEENTPFFRRQEFKKDAPRIAKFLFNELAKLGYEQYEISNFAKAGAECKHNLGYWTGREYIGFGAFSVGFLGDSRYYAHSNLKKYITEPTFRQKEKLSAQDLSLERLFLGLRSRIGVDVSNSDSIALEKIKTLAKAGKIYEKNGRIYNKNFLLADEISLFLT